MKGLINDPYPLRTFALRCKRKLNVGTYAERLHDGNVDRPHYGYCLYQGAALGKKLGLGRISVLEFGVAGGRGLLNLEYHAREIEQALGIEIEIYGFDTGKGLPRPVDYRDLPYHWKEGFFAMDGEQLQAKLSKATLVIGDVTETSQDFFGKYEPAPIAAVLHDLDFYSATAAALRMFDATEKYFLPRVFCYFDDIVGSETELYNDYTGERLAIREFNRTHETKKLAAAYHLLAKRFKETWHNQIFIYHDFGHSRYNDFISEGAEQLPLLPS
ncbi:MAG TPA: hypothetical protein VLL54_09525 [Pyrinomonadaceae bacterium]|nr:hypothetical protein [Pyrinomonadaceae bacterium]